MRKSMVFEGVAVTLLILLSFLMLAMLLSGGADKEVSGIGEIQYTYAGGDNTLYVFSGNDIHAIDADGAQKWAFRIPAQWDVCSYGFYYGMHGELWSSSTPHVYIGNPIVSSGNGTLYVYLKPHDANQSATYLNGSLMAISGGRELWELPLASHNISYQVWSPGYEPPQYGDARVDAHGDRVYVFHDYNETVIDKNGTILWNIPGVTDPAAVDEQGHVYCVRSTGLPSWDEAYPYDLYVPDYLVPSGVIDAYYPNGTLYWESTTASPLARQSVGGDLLPVYNNGMIYAPMYNGITALYPNGSVKWTKTYQGTDFKFEWPFDPNNLTASQESDIKYYEELFKASRPPGPQLPAQNGIELSLGLYSSMPFDREGNVYLQCISDIPLIGNSSYPQARMFLITIGPNGEEISRTNLNVNTFVAAKDGIGYATEDSIRQDMGAPIYPYSPSSVTDLESNKLIACDVGSGKELWSYTFTAKDPTVVTLDKDNVRTLIGGYEAEEAINNSGADPSTLPHLTWGPIMPGESLQVSAGDGTVYASFQSMNYEYPIVLGRSKMAYEGGIYAFDESGTLLWHKEMPPFGSMQVTQNGTVFYRTPDGKIGVTGAGWAAGFTVTAILYLFLRFLCIGAVARARARVNKNVNRDSVYDYILKNPGSTIYEISRSLSMNLGTVRYHIFILGMNHKIVQSRMDGKYIRYFTNSNSYSQEDQLIISLVRRERLGKMLQLLTQKPGISNIEIARTLDLTESETSRYVNELAEKGVVLKEFSGRECAYSINDVHRENVASAIRRLNGQ